MLLATERTNSVTDKWPFLAEILLFVTDNPFLFTKKLLFATGKTECAMNKLFSAGKETESAAEKPLSMMQNGFLTLERGPTVANQCPSMSKIQN